MKIDILMGRGTGALLRRPDPRDWDLAEHPRVAAAMAAPIPDVYSLKSSCKVVYDQGATSACVAYSIAGMQSGFEVLDEGEVITFDAARVYKDNGGLGGNGIFAEDVLKYSVKLGLPEVGNMDRRKLVSYAFTTDLGVICAALAANQFVVFALLLPTDFLAGDCGLGNVTSNYHQLCACGFDKTHGRLEFLNSWSKSYGQGGFGTILMSYLQSPAQQGFFYAYAATDVLETPPLPPLQPAITGYTDANGNAVAHFTPGIPIDIVGTGFGTTIGSVKLGTIDLLPVGWNDRQIIVNLVQSTMLDPFYGFANPVKLTVGSIVVTGPSLTLDKPVVPPLPPDKLIRLTLRPTLVKRAILMGGGASLVVEVTKYGTASGIANVPVNLRVNGKDLGTKTSKTSFVNWVISKADFHGTATLTVDDPKYYRTLRMVTLG